MTKKAQKFRFYDVQHLVDEYPKAFYYVVIGERSNGKTYSALHLALKNYFEKGEQFAYLRRFGEDIRKKQLSNLFASHEENGEIAKMSNGEWTSVDYTGGKFRLMKIDENNDIVYSEEPIGHAFDLNSMEHYKSISFPKITTVIFDEFLTRYSYLPNEFILFTNSLSTIIRQRVNVKIFMLGNTVNKYAPYFSEMGLSHIKEQKQGTVDVYKYGETGLEVVVEYCPSSSTVGGKKSDVYFAFDNPQLQMITSGSWEIAIYPRIPVDYKPKDVLQDFFIEFDKEILHGKVIAKEGCVPFVFLHRKTTEIRNDDDIVYGQVPDANPYHRVSFYNHKDKLSAFIRACYATKRIFYSENEVGEIFRNYLIWAENESIVRR